jgi:hypothetical protein
VASEALLTTLHPVIALKRHKSKMLHGNDHKQLHARKMMAQFRKFDDKGVDHQIRLASSHLLNPNSEEQLTQPSHRSRIRNEVHPTSSAVVFRKHNVFTVRPVRTETYWSGLSHQNILISSDCIVSATLAWPH